MDDSLASKIRAANATLLVDGDVNEVDDFFAPDYVAHLTTRDLDGGPAGVRAFVDMLRHAFADLEVEVDVLLEGEDRIAWQRTLTGTHEGTFQGFPATGRRITWRDMITSRLEDGRIAEEWAVSDLAEHLLRAKAAG